ncbi:MAG TPA: acyl carrier protein [Azospirillum sp.]
MTPTSIADIERRIADFIGAELSRSPDELDVDVNFGAFGLGSRSAVSLIGALEDALGVELSPVLVFENETIEKLAAVVGRQMGL